MNQPEKPYKSIQISEKLEYFLQRFEGCADEWFLDPKGRIRTTWGDSIICPIRRLIQGGGEPENWGAELGYSGKDILIITLASDNFIGDLQGFVVTPEELNYVRQRMLAAVRNR